MFAGQKQLMLQCLLVRNIEGGTEVFLECLPLHTLQDTHVLHLRRAPMCSRVRQKCKVQCDATGGTEPLTWQTWQRDMVEDLLPLPLSLAGVTAYLAPTVKVLQHT